MADGSQATFAGYPRTCSVCGRPVRMGGLEPLWFETTVVGRRQELRSYHFACRRSA